MTMRREANRGKAIAITRLVKLAGASKGNLYVKKTSLIVGTIITSVTRCRQNESSRETWSVSGTGDTFGEQYAIQPMAAFEMMMGAVMDV